MLKLRRCRVLRTPKTGSKWLTAALMSACRYCEDVGPGKGQGPKGYHATLRNVGEVSDLATVAFVRHPATWYGSYWNHRVRLGWKPEEHEFDRFCAANSFTEFMKKALDRFPGYCSQQMALWVGEAESSRAIEFVGRFESLEHDTVRFLELFREPFRRDSFVDGRRVNCGDYSKHPARLSDAMREQIDRQDCGIINRFYRN